jgi:outer membrane protein OmpA-like peptidoglycan-associated protein
LTTPRPHHSPRLGRLFGMAALALSAALPAQALDLRLPPAATPSATRSEALSSYNVPTGPWRAGVIPTTTAEGAITQTAWKIAAPGQTTLQLLQPLRDQIAKAGYTTLFECETAACGGFDFRYGTDILPEPQMHVDLGDFRFLAARRDGSDGADWLTLIVSRSADTGFVQITRIGAPALGPDDLTVSSKSAFSPTPELATAPAAPAALPQNDPLTAALTAGEHAILTDLQFPSGQATLAPGTYPSLAALADWLAANPQAQVELVGHTDASGNAQANIALSLARAEATRDALITLHGIDPTRIATRGAGPADPIASNDTPEGRAQNRRVEVIATPTL